MWVIVGLLSILVADAAARSCPVNFNSEAQIVIYTDSTISADAVLQSADIDTNLTFF